jgi:hypothetical protein
MNVLKEDIMKVFRVFRASGKFESSPNATFLALILRIPEAIDPEDFRSINIVGSIYKIIAKILANMLMMVLEKIISKSQNAFILDHILIANECLDGRMRFGDSGVI